MCSNTCTDAALDYMVDQYRMLRDYHQALTHNTQSVAQVPDIRQFLKSELHFYQSHLQRFDTYLEEIAASRRPTDQEQEMYVRYRKKRAQMDYAAAYTLLHMNMGYYGEYLSLLDQCFGYHWHQKRYGDQGVEVDKYLMELCPFRNVTQTAEDGSVILLGVWEESYHAQLEFGMMYGSAHNPDEGFTVVPVPERAQPYLEEMLFVGGEQCWDGPRRSVRTSLSCGPRNRLTAVGENGKCEYEFMFDTPAACTRVGYQQGQDTFRDLMMYFDFNDEQLADLAVRQEAEDVRREVETIAWKEEQEDLLALRRTLREETQEEDHDDENTSQGSNPDRDPSVTDPTVRMLNTGPHSSGHREEL